MRPLVVDASAFVDFLLRTPRAQIFEPVLSYSDADLHVPSFCDLEIVSALRSLLWRASASLSRAEKALRHYLDLPLTRHGHEMLVPRCFQLRDVLSPYDAAYVALAEVLRADLVTSDQRLARKAADLGVTCIVP